MVCGVLAIQLVIKYCSLYDKSWIYLSLCKYIKEKRAIWRAFKIFNHFYDFAIVKKKLGD